MSANSQSALLNEWRFLPFFLTQLLGATNDKIFKSVFTVLPTYNAAEWGGLNPESAGAVIGGVSIRSFVFRISRATPIAPAKADLKLMERAFNEVPMALGEGDANPVLVVRFALRGLWGSFFSRKDGAAMSQRSRFVPAAAAVPEGLKVRVATLRGDWR